MIKSYIQDIKSRRNKAAIFWLLVFISSIFLYLFFQWYYLSIDFKLDSKNGRNPTPVLRQFWIINIKVSQNPDNIFINWKWYSDGSKEMVDYGKYKVEIYKTWSISSEFDVFINKNYPIFFEDIYLFNKFKYSKFWENYSRIEKVENYYFGIKNDWRIVILDWNLDFYWSIDNTFAYLWHKYFANNSKIFVYDYLENKTKPFFKNKEEVQIECQKPIVYNDKLFCYDTMTFVDWNKIIKKNETIKIINPNIIMTENYIYNNSNSSNWSNYDNKYKIIYEPQNIVHLENKPYILENWILYDLENPTKLKLEIPELDEIKKTQEFGKELVLIGYKWSETRFVIINEKRRYIWILDKINANDIIISNNNWVYFINTSKNLYLYYKWSKKLTNILVWENIKIIENRVFFKKNSNNYYFDLSE